MANEAERNDAGKALFNLQFGIMMLNSGRPDECNRAFAKAMQLLKDLEKLMDEMNHKEAA